jgi:hypothetical protein
MVVQVVRQKTFSAGTIIALDLAINSFISSFETELETYTVSPFPPIFVEGTGIFYQTVVFSRLASLLT